MERGWRSTMISLLNWRRSVFWTVSQRKERSLLVIWQSRKILSQLGLNALNILEIQARRLLFTAVIPNRIQNLVNTREGCKWCARCSSKSVLSSRIIHTGTILWLIEWKQMDITRLWDLRTNTSFSSAWNEADTASLKSSYCLSSNDKDTLLICLSFSTRVLNQIQNALKSQSKILLLLSK